MDIHDIARHAGVSIATVSRTVNNAPNVDLQLAKRVRKAIKELGYYPNRQARALGSGKSRVFGLIVSEITNPFFPEIVETFESLAAENNYEILLISTVRDAERMAGAVRRMIEARVDGVAILAFGMEREILNLLRSRDLPVVVVDVSSTRPRVSCLRVDYSDGIRQAVQHLVALRHRRIGFVTGPLRLNSAIARKDAFTDSMRELGLPVRADFIVEGDHSLEGGKRAFRQILKLRPRPTAILCSNDMTAIGVMREAYDQRVEIPKEFSIIGFDDIRIAEFMNPPLTTIQMSQAELATTAFQSLMKGVKRESPALKGVEHSLRTRLILRSSTTFPESAQK